MQIAHDTPRASFALTRRRIIKKVESKVPDALSRALSLRDRERAAGPRYRRRTVLSDGFLFAAPDPGIKNFWIKASGLKRFKRIPRFERYMQRIYMSAC